MIDFYYWPTPNGWKVSILLEELQIPYKTCPINIGQGDQFTPKFLKISPNTVSYTHLTLPTNREV